MRLRADVATFLVLAAPAAAASPKSITDAPIRTVQAGQGKIGYRSVGKGRPLVLVMGLSGTMDAWPPSFVDSLAGRRRVITFDNGGIRRSTLGPGTLTVGRMADDVASLIRVLRLRRADVLGWSMGGMIAQSLARQHPKRVRRMVLCATAPGDGRATPPAADVITQLTTGTANTFQLLFPAPARLRGPGLRSRDHLLSERQPGRAAGGHARAARGKRHLGERRRSVGAPSEPAPAAGARGWGSARHAASRPKSALPRRRHPERPAPGLPGRRPRLLPAASARVRASGRSLPAGEGPAPSGIAAILRRSRLDGTRTAPAGTSSGSSRLPRAARRGPWPS